MILKNTDRKPVRVTMATCHDGEKILQSYNGSFQIKNGKKFLLYTEADEKCSITSDGKTVRINRFQSGRSLVFEENTEHICSYSTPAGTIVMTVLAGKITDNLEDGSLVIEYSLALSEEIPVNYKINITIEEI